MSQNQKRREFVLPEDLDRALVQMAHMEGIRLNQQFTPSDWLRRAIEKAASRKGLL